MLHAVICPGGLWGFFLSLGGCLWAIPEIPRYSREPLRNWQMREYEVNRSQFTRQPLCGHQPSKGWPSRSCPLLSSAGLLS